jgi:hypothetical protein
MGTPRGVALLMLGAMLVGCAEDRSVSPLDPIAKVSSQQVEEDIARASALSLNDEAVRTRLRDDMRASPWTDHKLSLTPYVTAEGGPVVAQAMTRAMGVGSEEMASRVNAMPSSDLSVARKEDRLSWTGTGNYLVVIAPREDEDPVVGFNPDGSREVLYPRADIKGRVLILIQPAEAKNLRTVRQSRVQGVTIQDPDDGSIGGSFSIIHGRDTIIFDLPSLGQPQRQQQCPEPELCPGDGGGGGGGSGSRV